MIPRIPAWYSHLHGMTKLALLLIVGVYAASFFMPVALVFRSVTYHDMTVFSQQSTDGWQVFWILIRTAVEVIRDPYDLKAYPSSRIVACSLAGFANPIAWLGFLGIVKEKGRLVMVAGLIAFVFGFSACLNLESTSIAIDYDYDYGYYVWLLPMLAMAFFGVWLMVADPRKRANAGQT